MLKEEITEVQEQVRRLLVQRVMVTGQCNRAATTGQQVMVKGA